MKLITKSVLMLLFLVNSALPQVPSTQITAKKSSGFLGLGGPRVVRIDLANKQRALPLTCENVNEDEQFYFLCSPVGDWRIDIDFVTENLSGLGILQDGQTFSVESSGEVVDGTILLGFPKTLRIHEQLQFILRAGDSIFQAEMDVPGELWPGATAYADLERRVKEGITASDHRNVITVCEQILGNPSFAIFPTYASMRDHRTTAFAAELASTQKKIEFLVAGEPATLKARISQIDIVVPEILFVRDSLPRADLQIPATEKRVAAILLQTTNTLSRQVAVRDSLQHALDDYSIRWILEGSVNGKNSLQFSYMIEALAYTFSSLNPAETSSLQFASVLSPELSSRLARLDLMPAYETFLRLCRERHDRREQLFPPGFLPNLRRDSASFPQPYYSMLKAVGEYYGGSLLAAQQEIATIVRTCTVADLVARFDLMRIYLLMRQVPPHPDALNLLSEAGQKLRQRDTASVLEASRQLGFISPTFAYGYYAFGMYFRQLNDTSRAQFAFQKAYQLDTLFLSAYLEAYRLMLEQRSIPPAIEVLQTALAKGNDCWTVRFNLGFVYLTQNDPVRAIGEFERALVFNNRSYETRLQLGLAYQAQKNYSRALEEFNNAISLDTTRPEAVERMTKVMEIQRTQR